MLAATATLLAALAAQGPSVSAVQPDIKLHAARDTFLIDEVVPIVLGGAQPGTRMTVRLTGQSNGYWVSSATFVADSAGKVDVTKSAPVEGSYTGVDAMGLFWSATRDTTVAPAAARSRYPQPDPWVVSVFLANELAATDTVWRRAVGSTVKARAVYGTGLVGIFYEPDDGKQHPAVMVLLGSGGGMPPPQGFAGGLASRGYAVLALAYFGLPRLPSQLSSIPLEYFGDALDWLNQQPSVDRSRIGVLGQSRGAELALILGTMHSQIGAVIAVAPGNVARPGCCGPTSMHGWTLAGKPINELRGPLFDMDSDPAARERATIAVEKINGPVLLLSGKEDEVWPSTVMSERIIERLRKNNFKHAYRHVAYDSAGHSLARPYTSTMYINEGRHPLTGRAMPMGGTPAGTARARAAAWQEILAFLEKTWPSR